MIVIPVSYYNKWGLGCSLTHPKSHVYYAFCSLYIMVAKDKQIKSKVTNAYEHELHKRSAGRYGNLFWNQQAAEGKHKKMPRSRKG